MNLKIGDLARETGTVVETIRFYEKIRLLPAPGRTSGNYRAYDASHLRRLSFIRRARDLGFSIDQVRELLSLADDCDRSCEAVDGLARQQLAEVDCKIADLTALRRELGSLIAQCGHGSVSECRIIETLGPGATAPA